MGKGAIGIAFLPAERGGGTMEFSPSDRSDVPLELNLFRLLKMSEARGKFREVNQHMPVFQRGFEKEGGLPRYHEGKLVCNTTSLKKAEFAETLEYYDGFAATNNAKLVAAKYFNPFRWIYIVKLYRSSEGLKPQLFAENAVFYAESLLFCLLSVLGKLMSLSLDLSGLCVGTKVLALEWEFLLCDIIEVLMCLVPVPSDFEFLETGVSKINLCLSFEDGSLVFLLSVYYAVLSLCGEIFRVGGEIFREGEQEADPDSGQAESETGRAFISAVPEGPSRFYGRTPEMGCPSSARAIKVEIVLPIYCERK
ncbi:unnamed protein product [Ranitomeya imitator]|uniref:Uncharacterized protein n=1 Tax=Ranitomeya imitator TaxID=111125 RepID=A0ABN9L082_9NEOB|nr:unnamed protein product [Ranitomeya imitator]